MNTEEVDDYLDYVSNPMDFEKMHIKLDDGEYRCAQVGTYRNIHIWYKPLIRQPIIIELSKSNNISE